MGSLTNLVGAEVREFAAFDVVPNSFCGIEIGSVAGQPIDLQPIPFIEQKLLHNFAAMRRKIVPDQDDRFTVDEMLQVLEEGNETLRIKAIRLGSGE